MGSTQPDFSLVAIFRTMERKTRFQGRGQRFVTRLEGIDHLQMEYYNVSERGFIHTRYLIKSESEKQICHM